MAQALPIPAGQPLEATRKAAGLVVALACAEAVAVQAAASVTLAALLWPLIPAARAMAGLASALGQQLPLRPLPEQQVVVVMPGSGGAGRAATVPGGRPGAVRAAGVITLGVEEEFVLLDPSDGATVLAAPELVRMLGGEPGIQQELMRFQVETGTPVCTGLDDLGRELIRLRRLAAAAAASAGCRLVACGVAPYRTPGLAADAATLRSRLLDHVGPALSDHGDTETITTLLRRLDQRGTGADRQRALHASAASTPAFITALARATLSGYQPGRWRRPGARVPAAAGAQ